MIAQATSLKRKFESSQLTLADYFGLTIQVVTRMRHCSLVRYCDRELIVNTEDLQEYLVLKQVA
jgi:hypothetical protein